MFISLNFVFKLSPGCLGDNVISLDERSRVCLQRIFHNYMKASESVGIFSAAQLGS